MTLRHDRKAREKSLANPTIWPSQLITQFSADSGGVVRTIRCSRTVKNVKRVQGHVNGVPVFAWTGHVSVDNTTAVPVWSYGPGETWFVGQVDIGGWVQVVETEIKDESA